MVMRWMDNYIEEGPARPCAGPSFIFMLAVS
jgi:hypothetical protein